MRIMGVLFLVALMAAGAINEPFAVINADDFYGAESYRMLAQHLQSGTGDYAMVGFVLRNTLSDFGTVARGVCRVSDTGLTAQPDLLAVEEPLEIRLGCDGEGRRIHCRSLCRAHA